VIMQDMNVLDTPALSRLTETPMFLVNGDLTEKLPDDLRPVGQCWLIVGSQGAQCRLHRDPPWVGWNGLLVGTKRWKFLPPDAPGLASVAVGSYGAAASDVDVSERKDVWEVLQEAGDVVIVPPNWWKQTFHETGPTVAVGSQLLYNRAMSDMLLCLQRSAGVPAVPLTGDITSDIQHVRDAIAGRQLERADRRAALRTTQDAQPVCVVAQPRVNLDDIEFID